MADPLKAQLIMIMEAGKVIRLLSQLKSTYVPTSNYELTLFQIEQERRKTRLKGLSAQLQSIDHYSQPIGTCDFIQRTTEFGKVTHNFFRIMAKAGFHFFF